MKLFKLLISEPDLEWGSIGGSHIRAHQSSAEYASQEPQSIEKSAGGNSTKIHLAVDAHGNLLNFIIINGVAHDIKTAPALLSLNDLSTTDLPSI